MEGQAHLILERPDQEAKILDSLWEAVRIRARVGFGAVPTRPHLEASHQSLIVIRKDL